MAISRECPRCKWASEQLFEYGVCDECGWETPEAASTGIKHSLNPQHVHKPTGKKVNIGGTVFHPPDENGEREKEHLISEKGSRNIRWVPAEEVEERTGGNPR